MSKPSADRTLAHWLVPSRDSIPADAVALVAFVVFANGVFFAPLTESVAVRALLGLPLLFFVPGYALVAALFPGCETLQASRFNWRVITDSTGATLLDRGIDLHERLALSFGASVALLPLLAIGLALAGLDYSLAVVAPTLGGLGVLGIAVAVVRRSQLPPHQRFQLPYERWVATVDRSVFGQRSAVDAVLNVALAVVVVASLAGVGYAAVTPNNAESFTAVSLLTEDEDGELTASGYPETIDESGEELVLEVQNHEGEDVRYVVVGELQHVRDGGDSVTVVRRAEVLRSAETVAAGDTWRRDHTVSPALTGDDLRLVYYVYRGDAPAEPDAESAYRHVNVWVDAPVETAE